MREDNTVRKVKWKKNCWVVVLVPVIINIQKLNIFYSEKGEISVSWSIKNGFMNRVGCQASFKGKEEEG